MRRPIAALALALALTSCTSDIQDRDSGVTAGLNAGNADQDNKAGDTDDVDVDDDTDGIDDDADDVDDDADDVDDDTDDVDDDTDDVDDDTDDADDIVTVDGVADGREGDEGDEGDEGGSASGGTRFRLAGAVDNLVAESCAVGCDDACVECNETSIGPVCGVAVDRGGSCFGISDGVLVFIDADGQVVDSCATQAVACVAGLECVVVSGGYTVWGQCLPHNERQEGELCGRDGDCAAGLHCTNDLIIGGFCTAVAE